MKNARFVTHIRVLEILILALTGLGAILLLKQGLQPVLIILLFGLLMSFLIVVMVDVWWLSQQTSVKDHAADKLACLIEELPETLVSAMKPQSELIGQKLAAMKQAGKSPETLMRDQCDALAQFKSSFEESINTVTNSLRQTAAEFSAIAGSLTERTEALLQALPEMLNGFRSQTEALLTETAGSAKALGQSLATGQVSQTEILSENLAKEIRTAADAQQQSIGALTSQHGEFIIRLNRAVEALEESGNLVHVNQAGLQSGIKMLNNSLKQILEKLQALSQRPEEEGFFIERLHQTLEAFHEKATEILIDTAQKSREILVREEQASIDVRP
jgi:hypothetical protein